MSSSVFQALQMLTWELERSRPFNRRKRVMLATTIMLLVLVTCIMSVVAAGAERQIRLHNVDIDNYNLLFSVCAGFMFFCLTLAVGLVGMWFVLESCFYLYRRRILHRARRRLVPVADV